MNSTGFQLILAAWLLLLNLGCRSSNPRPIYIPTARVDYHLTPQDEALLDSLQRRTFYYFWEQVNPANGLVKDRSTEKSPCSIAAVGFALPAYAVAVERGWITRAQAADRTLATLRFFYRSEQSPEPLATGYQGFYYHFINLKTGQREWNCELSTVDTAWLLGGVRFSRQYFNQAVAIEQEIRMLADSLTFRVNWSWATFPDRGRYANLVCFGWTPEAGFHEMGWFGYTEAQFLYILAAGSGYAHAEKAYQHWLKSYEWREPYPGLAHLPFSSLFGHQWTQVFIDLRGLVDDYLVQKGIDYFENSRRATLTQRQYAMDNPNGWVGYDSLIWGMTACDGPGAAYNKGQWRFSEYAARGTSGPKVDHDYEDDGTIAPTAAAGSIVFAPEIVIPTLHAMYQRYGSQGLWGRYGFHDAFNPTLNWFAPDFLGIDQGPIILMLENFRTGMICKYMQADPVIQTGLKRLGFRAMTSPE